MFDKTLKQEPFFFRAKTRSHAEWLCDSEKGVSVKDEGPKQSTIVRLVTESILCTLPENFQLAPEHKLRDSPPPNISVPFGGAWVGVIFHDFLFT